LVPERKNRIIHDETGGVCQKCWEIIDLCYIRNSCAHNFPLITERYDDICRIIYQELKAYQHEMVNINDKPGKKSKVNGCNSQIKLPTHFKDHILEEQTPVRDMREGQLHEEVRSRPNIWSYKIDKFKMNKVQKSKLTLNLIEVSVPFGHGKAEWSKI
jgi:hypothetical protein